MPPDQKNFTTMWVSKKVKKQLDALRRKGETYNDLLIKFLRFEGDVAFDIISVDGEIPLGHEIVFKLGKFTYVYKDGEVCEVEKIKITPLGVESIDKKT